jgi:hypothetical protein
VTNRMWNNFIGAQIERTNRNLFIANVSILIAWIAVSFWHWPLGVLGLPLLVLSLWNLRKWMNRRSAIERHPLVKQLALYGEPSQIASQIEQSGHECLNIGGVILQGGWIVRPGLFSVPLIHEDELVCICTKTTSKGGFNVKLTSRSGSQTAFNCSEPARLAEVLYQHVPWLSRDHKTLLPPRMFKNDFSRFVEEVNKRKRDWEDTHSAK